MSHYKTREFFHERRSKIEEEVRNRSHVLQMNCENCSGQGNDVIAIKFNRFVQSSSRRRAGESLRSGGRFRDPIKSASVRAG